MLCQLKRSLTLCLKAAAGYSTQGTFKTHLEIRARVPATFDVLVKLFPEVAVEVKLTSSVCASPFLGSFSVC